MKKLTEIFEVEEGQEFYIIGTSVNNYYIIENNYLFYFDGQQKKKSLIDINQINTIESIEIVKNFTTETKKL
jgi:hypothetical protein